MVLPFVTIGSKVFFCSLADRHRAYRSMFICFLTIALIGYGSYGVLPFFVSPQPKENGLNLATWILICIITAVSTIAMSVITCLSDTFAVNTSKRRNTSYGKVRVWGTLGWGLSSLLLSFINQSDKLPLLVPGLIMTATCIFADVLFASLWPHKEDFKLERLSNMPICHDIVVTDSPQKLKSTPSPVTRLTDVKCGPLGDNNYGTKSLNGSSSPSVTLEQPVVDTASIRIQWRLFREVARRRKSIFMYMILFTLSGAVISLQWSYFFLYLKDIYAADFAFISGFAMVIDSMLGELPFFLVSDYIIRILGRTHTLSFSFMSIGVRYLLYQYLLPNSSMYFVILSEILQGPSFVLFYVVMTEIGNEYSDCEYAIARVINEGLVPNNPENVDKLRQSLRATMQSIVNSCYEGLGLGIGSIVGGVVIQQYGFENLWFYSALLSLLVGIVTSVSAPR